MELNNILVYVACIIVLFLFGRIFVLPLKNIFKLIANSMLGALLIGLINLIGGIWGFHIGLNLITSALIGILGIPGAILLVLLKLVL